MKPLSERIKDFPANQFVDWLCLSCVDVREVSSEEDAQGEINKIREAVTNRLTALEKQRDALAENDGYKQAFYEMAEILGIGARADSPKNVFEQVIKPMLINLHEERFQLAAENAALKDSVALLLEDARRVLQVEPNAGTESRINTSLSLLIRAGKDGE